MYVSPLTWASSAVPPTASARVDVWCPKGLCGRETRAALAPVSCDGVAISDASRLRGGVPEHFFEVDAAVWKAGLGKPHSFRIDFKQRSHMRARSHSRPVVGGQQ